MRRILPVLILSLIPPVQAAGLSLSDAEALWQQNSHELRLGQGAVASATAGVQTAGQRPNPDLSLNTLSISPWSGYGSGSWLDKKMDTVLRIEQLIERGDKRTLRMRGAEARLEAARFDLDDIARQQRSTLHTAYYALRLAQERQALARDTAELYRRSAESGKLRLKSGDMAPVDLSRLQIDQARAEADARQAEADLHKARVDLGYLIGRSGDLADLEASDDWPSLEMQALAAASLDQRPDLEAAERRVKAAEADRALAHAKKSRDVTIGVQYEHNLQNAPTNSYGFGISIPLFVWHEYEGDIAQAEADFDLARHQFALQLAQADGQVAQARNALLAARERCQRLQDGLLGDAERVARAAEFAYGKGAMSLMDLLDARRTLRQIQLEAANARADYAKALSDWQAQAAYRKKP